ncbi:MAG: hypothetical protein ACLFMO_08075, partial [Eubacteriales bacterium]
MRLVFAHDHIFHKHKNVLYSTGSLTKKMLERYTMVFETVQVVSRQKKLQEFNGKLTLASAANVEFTPVPNFKSLKKYLKVIDAKAIIEEEVKNSDAVIA